MSVMTLDITVAMNVTTIIIIMVMAATAVQG